MSDNVLLFKDAEPVGPLRSIWLFCLYFWDFWGRSSRSEYWWALLVPASYFAAIMSLSSVMERTPFLVVQAFMAIILAAHLLAAIALTSRRLRDARFSAWWSLLLFIPTGVVFIALMALRRSGPVAEDEEGEDVSVDREVVQPPSLKAKSSVPKSPQANAPLAPTTLRAQMKELDELFHDGVITQEQRDAAKNRALGI